MSDYFWTNEHTDASGVKHTTIEPWNAEDFKQAIAQLEDQITPRRRDEAIISEEGRLWLINQRQAIATLRENLDENIVLQ